MRDQLVWIVTAFGLAASAGVFWRMRVGLGPFNPRAMAHRASGHICDPTCPFDSGSITATLGIVGR
jgi:hypothetical protein